MSRLPLRRASVSTVPRRALAERLRRVAGLLAGALVLIGFQALGDGIAAAMDWPLPGAVIGMVLLWLALCLLGRVPSGLEAVAAVLLSHLLLPLIPAVAAIIGYRDLLAAHGAVVALICGVGILVSVPVALLAYRLAGGLRR